MLVSLVAASVALAAPRPAGAVAAPTLRIVTTRPLTVRGVSFLRLEKVRVVAVTSRSRRVLVVRADVHGRWVARFPGLVVTRCTDRLQVSTVGARGSRAGFTLAQLQCDQDVSTT